MSNKTSWLEENNKLKKTFKFTSFTDAILFMQKCVTYIESINHHPTWSNVYNQVMVELQTHDEGNIVTSKDWDLANEMDLVYNKYFKS
jgi:4a-hydroxytetrahydrobiopterin dehydratase